MTGVEWVKSFTALTVFGFLDNRPEQLEAAIERAVRNRENASHEAIEAVK
jgi:hypothetical protein